MRWPRAPRRGGAPGGTVTRRLANPAAQGRDVLSEGDNWPVSYPDAQQHLVGPDEPPHFVVAWILEAHAQLHEFVHRGVDSGTEYLATAAGLEDRAEDQATHRDTLRHSWDDARERLEKGRRVLTPFLQHHGSAEDLRYGATWALLLAGDTAAGALVLIQGGEYPFIALVMMLALGAAAVTCGLLGHDLRRRALRRSLPKSHDDPAEAALIDKVFAAPEEGWRLVVRMTVAALFTSLAIAAGTFAYRQSIDGTTVGIAFGMWTLGIGAASWWNAWRHCDPARVVLGHLGDQADECHTAYTEAPVDAIEERARALASAREISTSHHLQGQGAFFQTLAAGARALAANPQMAGHTLSVKHYLLEVVPPEIEASAPVVDSATAGDQPASPQPGKPSQNGSPRRPGRPRKTSPIDSATVQGAASANGVTGNPR